MAALEVVSGLLTVYVAPVGTAFPAVNAAPAGAWFELGTNGAKNYDEPGVVVTHDQTINEWRPAGGTVARKAFRSAEDITIEFTLVDLTPEQYAKTLNDATVTTAVGPPATKTFNLAQGITVTTFALLACGTSNAIGASLPAQYQVPIVYQASSPKLSFQKDKPAGLDLQFKPLEDSALGIGSLVIQTA